MPDVVAPDAHDVYVVRGDSRVWVATFSVKLAADLYTVWAVGSLPDGARFEVVPV